MNAEKRVALDDLRCLCDPGLFDFETTADIAPLDGVIGQERAVRAIRFGLEMKSAGYHIFVTGPEGTGKTTIVQQIVRQTARQLPVPPDWCMVNNFKNEYHPRAISMKAGQGIRFSKSLNRLINDLTIRLPKAFEAEPFREKIGEIQKRFGERKKENIEMLEAAAKERQLKVEKTPSGYQTVPMNGEEPFTQEAFEQLGDEEKSRIGSTIEAFQEELQTVLRDLNRLNQAQQKEIQEVSEELAHFVVKNRLDLLREAYPDQPATLDFLDAVQTDLVDNVGQFLSLGHDQQGKKVPSAERTGFSFDRYKVNVLEDRSELAGAPVVFEPNPSEPNMFGRIEKKGFMGTLNTDFSMVQSGALLKANGGFLVLEIDSVLAHPRVWESLKRALQNKMLCIEENAPGIGASAPSLRPEPIALDVKVILLGGVETFRALQNHDAKFNKIFKVRADFDYEVARTKETVSLYAQFIAKVCLDEALLPFTTRGVAAVVEYGKMAIDSKAKLSLRFGNVASVVREAAYWARKEGETRVGADHVDKALAEHRFRHNLYEEKIHENYLENTVMIDVAGQTVGQVNALAVYQLGEIAFGRPSRVTAETFMGKPGIVNIEREANLSGNTHDKGVLILAGYLGKTFAQQYPLSLSISLTFEQSYSGVEGDSASSTELYAILSSLSQMPIRQGIAVTGSVNQKGQVQAVGGVNQKIEGFFDVCRSKGLTGAQGVLIPESNVKNLMLKKSVLEAVRRGQFTIWQVSTIEEGIEILTGAVAGTPDATGKYAPGTVYGKVQRKLETYLAQSLKLRKAGWDPTGEET